MKAFWIVTAIVALLGGVAISRPEVRNWMDDQFPALGINGKNPRPAVANASSNADSMESFNSPRLVNIDAQGDLLPQVQNTALAPQDAAGGVPLTLPAVQLPDGPNGNPALAAPGNQAEVGNPQQLGAPSNLPTPRARSQFGGTTPGFAGESSGSMNRNASGRLVARAATLDFVRKIDVVAQADGIITKLHVDEGSYVKEGAPLIELDSRIAQAEVLVQNRELEQAKLKAGNTAQIDFAKAAFEKAKIDVEISEKLMASRAEDQSTYRAKLLERKKAELQIQVSEIEHAQEVAAVAVSEAKLDAANVQITLRNLVAPWDGFVSEVAKHQYSYVRAGEMVFTLCDLTRMRVRGNVAADIPPNHLFGAPALVKISIAPGVEREIEGVIGHVSYETKGGEEYNVWVEIPNEQLPDGQFLFRKGMKATLLIEPKG